MKKTLITRTDDFGSARAANAAILEALTKGFVKNVSCMAVGPQIDADAKELVETAKKYGVCIGLHAAINAEWDFLKFLPVLPPQEIPSLVTKEGTFYMHPMMFATHMPQVEEVMKEIRGQLELLTKLGLPISYVDTHMLPDSLIPGLTDALTEFAKEKGLIDQRWFYTFPTVKQPVPDGTEKSAEEVNRAYAAWLDSFEEKQYICVMHPAKYSRETLFFRNPVLTGDSVARSRDAEYRFLTSDAAVTLLKEHAVTPIPYTQALPFGDTIKDAVKSF